MFVFFTAWRMQRKLWTMAEAGYTTFDTADIYGPSEGILGEFNAAWSQAGKPPVQVRETRLRRRRTAQMQRAHRRSGRLSRGAVALQILTKYVPNIFQQRPTPAAVEAAVRRSLSNLQVRAARWRCSEQARVACVRASRAPGWRGWHDAGGAGLLRMRRCSSSISCSCTGGTMAYPAWWTSPRVWQTCRRRVSSSR